MMVACRQALLETAADNHPTVFESEIRVFYANLNCFNVVFFMPVPNLRIEEGVGNEYLGCQPTIEGIFTFDLIGGHFTFVVDEVLQ